MDLSLIFYGYFILDVWLTVKWTWIRRVGNLPAVTSGVMPILCRRASASLRFFSRSESSCGGTASFFSSAWHKQNRVKQTLHQKNKISIVPKEPKPAIWLYLLPPGTLLLHLLNVDTNCSVDCIHQTHPLNPVTKVIVRKMIEHIFLFSLIGKVSLAITGK